MHKGYKVPPAESNPVRAAAGQQQAAGVRNYTLLFFSLSYFRLSFFLLLHYPATTGSYVHTYVRAPENEPSRAAGDGLRNRYLRAIFRCIAHRRASEGCRVADAVNTRRSRGENSGSIRTEGRNGVRENRDVGPARRPINRGIEYSRARHKKLNSCSLTSEWNIHRGGEGGEGEKRRRFLFVIHKYSTMHIKRRGLPFFARGSLSGDRQ